MTKSAERLAPNRRQLETFINAMFRHADEGTTVAFRAFDRNDQPLKGLPWPVKINGQGLAPVTDAATRGADKAANHPEPAVFCPPIATFSPPENETWRAREQDLANGLALSVECDQAPSQALKQLRELLGSPTIVVASGGQWTSPEGATEPKLHLHWRLNEPTRTKEDHERLKRLRALCCALVGADATSNTIVHPLRWPGSWHRKGEPKLCRILSLSADSEIDLGDALDVISLKIKSLPQDERTRVVAAGSGEERADAKLIAEILSAAEYHRPLCALAARYVGRGMSAAWVIASLQGFMLSVPEDIRDCKPGAEREPGRWKARYDSIGGLVSGAEAYCRRMRRAEQGEQADDPLAIVGASQPSFGQGDGGTARIIRIIDGELPRIVDEAEAALIAADRGLYQRGGLIVRPVLAPVPVSGGRRVISQRLLDLNEPALVEHLTAAAKFEKYDARANKWKSVDCPAKVGATLLARGQWKLPPLVGVVSTPVMRPDGSILNRPGYDPETRLLFDPGDQSFPPIKEEPTHDDAKRALALLHDTMKTFPFAGGKDSEESKINRSVAIGAYATAIQRRCLKTAPGMAVTATAPGSGKSKIVDMVAGLATGRPCPVIGQGGSAEEAEKRLASALIAGDALINIDNCEHPLSGELLCQALTQDVLSLRLLGQSKNVLVPAAAAIFATGNNLRIVGDLTRRMLVCSLDPDTERPELRSFDYDPIELVLSRRGELVAAVLTILRGYHRAGRPPQKDAAGGRLTPLGSFEDWSTTIRDALVWAGEADPARTLDNAREADPERAQLHAVIEAWAAAKREKVLDENPLTAKQLIDAAMSTQDESEHRLLLREALMLVASDHGAISSRRLGNWLSKFRGRGIGQRKIEQAGNRSGVATWNIGGFSGLYGSVLFNTREMSDTDKHKREWKTTPLNPLNPRSDFFDPDGAIVGDDERQQGDDIHGWEH